MSSKKGNVKDIEVIDIHHRKIIFPRFLYVVKVIWSNGNQDIIYRKYAEFVLLQTQLLEQFPNAFGGNGGENCRIPLLPGQPVQYHICRLKEAVQRLDILYKFCKGLPSMPDSILQSDKIKSFFLPKMSDVKRQRQHNTLTISAPIPTEEYQAKASYRKRFANEMSLKDGEIVAVLEKDETGWWKVFCDKGIGWVPRSYLMPLRDEPREITLGQDCCNYVTVKDYKAQMEDELDIEKGFVMSVIEMNDNGWWKVRCKNREGLVPRTCISAIDSEDGKKVLNSVLLHLQKDMVDQGTTELRNNQNILNASPKRTPRYKPLPPLPVLEKSEIKNPWLDASLGSDAEKTPEATYLSSSNNMRQSNRQMRAPQWHSRESTRMMSPSGLLRSPSFQDNYLRRQQFETEECYRTVGSFSSAVCDGLSFTTGQILKISRKNDSGWWYAHFMEKEGWVPASYLVKVVEDKSSSQ